MGPLFRLALLALIALHDRDARRADTIADVVRWPGRKTRKSRSPGRRSAAAGVNSRRARLPSVRCFRWILSPRAAAQSSQLRLRTNASSGGGESLHGWHTSNQVAIAQLNLAKQGRTPGGDGSRYDGCGSRFTSCSELHHVREHRSPSCGGTKKPARAERGPGRTSDASRAEVAERAELVRRRRICAAHICT